MFFEGGNKLRTLAAYLGCIILLLCALWYLGSRIFHATSGSPRKSSLESFESLPYISWAPISTSGRSKSGVTWYDPDLSCPGLNIYQSENYAGAYLLDMAGKAIHTFSEKRTQNTWWKLVEPYQDGDFLVLIENLELRMIDWDSNIKWAKAMNFHHDVAVDDKGNIFSLTQKPRDFPEYSTDEAILDDFLIILTKDGEVKREISFADLIIREKGLFEFARNPSGKVSFRKDAWDIFHTNTIEIIDRNIYSKNQNLFTRLFEKKKVLFHKGNVLFCIRNLDIIGLIDLQTERIIWHWGRGELDRPHHPSLLANGNLLIFDNGLHRGFSRVIELNPATEKIVWQYTADPPHLFFSETRGSAQRLPNGNTLITESDKGHVFEITRKGLLVWEFFSPQLNTEKNKRATIYRMMRIVNPEDHNRIMELIIR